MCHFGDTTLSCAVELLGATIGERAYPHFPPTKTRQPIAVAGVIAAVAAAAVAAAAADGVIAVAAAVLAAAAGTAALEARSQ